MNPILNAVILFFVFRAIFKIRSLGEIDFFPYVYSGVLLVNFFTQAVTQASEQLTNNSAVLRRVNIPGEIFVVSSVISNIVNFLFGFIPLLLYFFITGHELSWTILGVPLLLLSLSFIVTPLALFLSVAYVYFQDLRFLVPVIMNLLFYLTPVFYDLEAIGGRTRVVMGLNPLVTYLQSFRSTLSINGSIHFPSILTFTIAGFYALYLALRFMERNRMKAVFLS